MTSILKNKIKKYWLYTLFPTIIYSLPLLNQILTTINKLLIIISITLFIIYGYFIYRFLKGFRIIDTILIPFLIICLNIITLTVCS